MNSNTIQVVVHGASGRMGHAVLAACDEQENIQVLAAVSRNPNSKLLMTLDEVSGPANVLIDFSLPAGLERALEWCVDKKTALLSGTTGLDDHQHQQLRDAARHIPVLWSSNMSLGANLLVDLSARVAGQLGLAADVEIIDAHHRYKRDAPSGTAVSLGQAIAESRKQDFSQVANYERTSKSPRRQSGEIGFSVIRAGDIAGNHAVLFGLDGEQLELTHRAFSRECFARGAVAAAAWLAAQPPGQYQMGDVLRSA